MTPPVTFKTLLTDLKLRPELIKIVSDNLTSKYTLMHTLPLACLSTALFVNWGH